MLEPAACSWCCQAAQRCFLKPLSSPLSPPQILRLKPATSSASRSDLPHLHARSPFAASSLWFLWPRLLRPQPCPCPVCHHPARPGAAPEPHACQKAATPKIPSPRPLGFYSPSSSALAAPPQPWGREGFPGTPGERRGHVPHAQSPGPAVPRGPPALRGWLPNVLVLATSG